MKSPLMTALVAATLAFAHNAGAQDDDQNYDRYMGVGLSSSANVDQSTDLFGSDDHRDNPDSNSAKKAFFGFISRDAVGDSGIGFEFGYVERGFNSQLQRRWICGVCRRILRLGFSCRDICVGGCSGAA